MEPTSAPTPPSDPPARLRVLASGSGGNCTVLVITHGESSHRVLIDAGLSPRRTRRLLEDDGLELADIDAVLLTHLDSDHFNPGWRNTLPATTTLCMHQRHANHAARTGFAHGSTRVFTEAFEPFDGIRVDPLLLPHDQLGVTAYRIAFDRAGGPPSHLGFATDLGRVSNKMIDRFRGVDVLAIESNYCPRMQRESDRPEFLKRRIMGGAGHLSNEESARAVESIDPREHVVFLHLSRQCNDPAIIAELHAHQPYAYTIAEQLQPTRWISVGASNRPAIPTPAPSAPQARTLDTTNEIPQR